MQFLAILQLFAKTQLAKKPADATPFDQMVTAETTDFFYDPHFSVPPIVPQKWLRFGLIFLPKNLTGPSLHGIRDKGTIPRGEGLQGGPIGPSLQVAKGHQPSTGARKKGEQCPEFLVLYIILPYIIHDKMYKLSHIFCASKYVIKISF